MKNKNLGQAIKKLYYILLTSLIFHLGMVLGLGVFSLVPTLVLAFELVGLIKDNYKLPRTDFISYSWKAFKKYIKSQGLISLAVALIYLVLASNYTFFGGGQGFLSTYIHYISLVLIVLLSIFSLSYAYVLANYKDLSIRQALKNAFFISLAYFLELAVFLILMFIGFALVDSLLAGLVIFLGPAVFFVSADSLYAYLLGGNGSSAILKDAFSRRSK